jgi:hypothetical protein
MSPTRPPKAYPSRISSSLPTAAHNSGTVGAISAPVEASAEVVLAMEN